jgi:hypothetical protein
MDVIALANGRNYAADVLTVLDHGIANGQVLQCDLVAEGYVLIEEAAELAVILGYDAVQISAGGKVLDDYHADVVAAVMHEQVRYLVHDDPRMTRATYKG